MARWLGRWLHPLPLRAASMMEQSGATLTEVLTPTDGYFRRDRHRHPRVDGQRWRLRVSGVGTPRELALQDLYAMPSEERVCVMECAGNGNGGPGT